MPLNLSLFATRYPNAGFDVELVADVDAADIGRQPISEARREQLRAEREMTEEPLGDDLVIVDGATDNS